MRASQSRTLSCPSILRDLVKVTAVRQSSGEVLGECLEAHVVEVDAHADLNPGELQPQAGAAAAAAKIA